MLNQQVITTILEANNLEPSFLDQEINKIALKGVDFADFYLQHTATESWVLDEGIIKSGSYAVNQGIGIRAICGEKTFFSYANARNEKVISNLVANLYLEPVNTQSQKYSHDKKLVSPLYTLSNPIATMESIGKIKILERINQLARKLPHVMNVIASINLEYDQIYLVRSDKEHFSDIRPLIHMSVSIIVNRNGQMERAGAGGGGRYDISYFNDEVIDGYIERAYNQAIL